MRIGNVVHSTQAARSGSPPASLRGMPHPHSVQRPSLSPAQCNAVPSPRHCKTPSTSMAASDTRLPQRRLPSIRLAVGPSILRKEGDGFSSAPERPRGSRWSAQRLGVHRRARAQRREGTVFADRRWSTAAAACPVQPRVRRRPRHVTFPRRPAATSPRASSTAYCGSREWMTAWQFGQTGRRSATGSTTYSAAISESAFR